MKQQIQIIIKRVAYTLIALVLVSGLTAPVRAAVQNEPGSGGPAENVEVTDEVFDSFDPLIIGQSADADALSTPAGIINKALSFAFPLAGMILFVMIVVGGFQMVVGGGEQKSLEAGRQRVTMAIIGFILLFSSYWIAQILESLLNIKIL